jgi:hypothetical protein
MGILLRLIKVVLGICLIPVWFIVITFGLLIVIPILLVADLFKYIITGKAGLAEWFVIDSDSLFSFEGLTFGWASYLSKLYDKKFLKKL